MKINDRRFRELPLGLGVGKAAAATRRQAEVDNAMLAEQRGVLCGFDNWNERTYSQPHCGQPRTGRLADSECRPSHRSDEAFSQRTQ
ncbi:MAG: hypothetical protein VX346_25000 [Planctomycetota bacterium]|nr:hypothetical protein [Planctomycetota bacterium]